MKKKRSTAVNIENRRNLLDMPFQFVKRIYKLSDIRNVANRIAITNQYRILQNRINGIGDFFLQYPQRLRLLPTDREIVHDIQRNAGSLILSDYELDRYQDADTFENQICTLRDDNQDKVVCPTIDIRIEDEDLFSKKVDKVIDNQFDRFNIIYGSIDENIANWIDLSRKIYDAKKVWCNVVGVIPRWQRSTMISQISRVFLFGVHTISLGYPWIGSPNASTHIFNTNSHRFELVPRGMSYVEGRTNAVIGHRRESAIGRNHIINGTYFTRYVPSREGLNQALIAVA